MMRLGVINGAAGMRRRGALALLVVLAGTPALASGAGRASDGTVFPAVELGSMSAGGSVGVPRRALSTTAPVLQLAADGTTVAAVVGPKSRYVIGQSTECAKQLVIWNVRRKTPVVMNTGATTITGSNLVVTVGTTLSVGQTFLIGQRTASQSITGQFAQGSTVTGSDGSVFSISYTGGNGNDIVLTVTQAAAVPEPSTWRRGRGFPILLATGVAFARSDRMLYDIEAT